MEYFVLVFLGGVVLTILVVSLANLAAKGDA